MLNESQMNVLYCGDGNIEDGVIISSLSLCQTVKRPIRFFILTANITHRSTSRKAVDPRFAEFLQAQLQRYNPQSTVTLIDGSDLFSANPPTANMDTRFTPGCMLRLYADLAEGLPDRILYLDNDVICRKDPSAFYDQDMEKTSVAGVLDYYGSWFFKKNIFKRDYLNSGVLLLNMKRIRETALFEKCRTLCRDEEMFLPDQSALNRLCADKKICKAKYNEQHRLRSDTVFQHFTTAFRFFPLFHTVSVKPWNVTDMHRILNLHEYDALLEEYQEISQGYKKGNL
ncbi:MAG: glycosyltransferase family 8 protein [Clostridia bacterium]|nr:glycosyltransferase family 8 protein [Clostridia bacterium]